MKLLKEKEKELLEESRSKDQQCAQLLAEIPKLPKEVNRSAYTQRILEIINNVRKQRCEIDKVLADTREIQKEINTLTGRLERSFTVADELIFKDAKTNEASRKAYKFLATLHSDCAELVTLVEETGATVREIRDLEEQVRQQLCFSFLYLILNNHRHCNIDFRLIQSPLKMLALTWRE